MHRLHRAFPFAIGVLIASGGAHATDNACDPALEHFHLCKTRPAKPASLRPDAFNDTAPSASPAAVAPLSLRPVVVTPEIETWTTQFPMLSSSIQAWATHAGYTVMWKASTDRNLPAPLQFRGTFEEACRQAFDLYRETTSRCS